MPSMSLSPLASPGRPALYSRKICIILSPRTLLFFQANLILPPDRRIPDGCSIPLPTIEYPHPSSASKFPERFFISLYTSHPISQNDHFTSQPQSTCTDLPSYALKPHTILTCYISFSYIHPLGLWVRILPFVVLLLSPSLFDPPRWIQARVRRV